MNPMNRHDRDSTPRVLQSPRPAVVSPNAAARENLVALARHAAASNGFGAPEAALDELARVTSIGKLTDRDAANSSRYALCVANSRRVRFDIDRDVIRGRSLDFTRKFLPDGLSRIDRLTFLTSGEKRLLSQIQGRTYANIFGLVERFIAAKILAVSGDHALGDQHALEALVRFGDEEIKHQELFRRIEAMCAAGMPPGYSFLPAPNEVARTVLAKSTWAVLALICHIEIFVLAHYRESIASDAASSELWKDVFLFHWREESQHAIIDEMEWRREHEKLSPQQRDAAVDDLVDLVRMVDGVLQIQSAADAAYFLDACGRPLSPEHRDGVRAGFLDAYRWQYIGSGIREPRFAKILASLVSAEQATRMQTALAPFVN
jgi:hypothetical protein